MLAQVNIAPTLEPENILVTVLDDGEETAEGFGLPTTSILENQLTRIDGLFENADQDDVHTVVIDWGDGTTTIKNVAAGERGFSAEKIYLDDDPSSTDSDDYTIEVVVTDDDGGSGTASIEVEVTNVAPAFDRPLALAQTTIDENDLASLSGEFLDPGSLDIHSLKVNWGDGSALETVVLPDGDRDFNLTHRYLEDSGTDSYPITVTLFDDDGGEATATTSVAVLNVAPTVSFPSAPTTGLEGTEITIVPLVIDPGTTDVLTYDWLAAKDGVPFAAAVTPEFNFTPDDNGSYEVQLTVTDDDNGSGTATPITIAVSNVAPLITPADLNIEDQDGLVVSAIIEGNTITLSGTFDDPGSLDTHDVDIDWGTVRRLKR